MDQKQKNPKIGRPTKTCQEQQFKMHYLNNKRKIELECELLVLIQQECFDEIPTSGINRRVPIRQITELFEEMEQVGTYEVLLKLNEIYFKNCERLPEERLKYTSIIDLAYIVKFVKQSLSAEVCPVQLLLILLFHLYNEKLVNEKFFEYFRDRLVILRLAMMKGPEAGYKLRRIDKVIIALLLEIAVNEQLTIVENAQILYQLIHHHPT